MLANCTGRLCLAIIGAWSSTQFLAHLFQYQSALGASWGPVYAPWAGALWIARHGAHYPGAFALGLAPFVIVLLAIALFSNPRLPSVKPFGARAWGARKDALGAGLMAPSGAVIGKLDGEILCYGGEGHQLLVGASRAGKGRGQVVPTLLTWPGSALVFDVKGELADGDARHGFAGVAGWRERLGPVLRFAPTKLDSASFNPLFEVRKGANEVRDVQNLVEILCDPRGDGADDFWDRSAKNILVGLVLHVLYAEPLERKTLAVVREKLRDLDAAALEMKSILHRRDPVTNRPQVHPEVLHAAESYLAGEERLQSGVKATAESFFGIFADAIVAEKTSASDFRIGDLMCAERPVTLFLQPPPSDTLRLTPLLRLIINQFARALMEDQLCDAQGRSKRHRLIFVLDEFPLLGRMPFFEAMMGAMAGYGLKALLVAQSLNHIIKAYGRDNVIVDNCHVVTAFAAADNETAKRIAEMAGEKWEMRTSHTRKEPEPLFGRNHGSRTVREERRPLLLASDVRALPGDEQLVFVSGAKPIRAKKLRFDEEPVFCARLAPTRRRAQKLSSTHDWQDVAALGSLEPPRTQVRRRRPSRPALAQTLAPQDDLFTRAAVQPKASISQTASSGLRRGEGAPLAHSSNVQGAPSDARARASKRTKGL